MDDDDSYVLLIASLKPSGRRPLSPINTAKLVEQLVNEEGKENAELLLPIEKDMIGYFLRLKNNLPERCHGGVLWGTSNDLGVGFSAAHFIATLDNDEDKITLFSLCSQEKIPKEDIKKIVSYANRFKLTIGESIEKVKGLKPQLNEKWMVVLAISEESIKKLQEKSNREGNTPNEILEKSIREKFEIESISHSRIRGKNIAFSINESDFKKYQNKIKELKLIFDEITSYIVNDDE